MVLDIVNLNHNGEGVGRLDGKVIFVPKTVVGDVVLVKNIIDYGNYLRGEILEFVKYSDKRCKAKCSYYKNCGGCQIMSLGYSEQLVYKKTKVVEIFDRYGSSVIEPEIVGDNDFGYRNKIVFQVKDGMIGFFEHGSNDIVKIDNCLLISDKMNKVISIISDNVDLKCVDRVMLKESDLGIMIVFYGKVILEDISIFKDLVCSVYINDEKVYGSDNIMLSIFNYKFVVSPDSFFQVNLEITKKLYSYVKDSIDIVNPKVLDLYCGVGSIGIFCASKCKEVIGVEVNANAIKNANINKSLNGVNNISFMCLNANKIKYGSGDFDVVIVDPPRGGLDRKTLSIIKEIRSELVIYVSCNPVTLVRDFNSLSCEYDIKDLKLFDMFPNSYHVESVLVMVKK